ncbi:protein singed wings 2 [Aphidius gifuensis]|uniref:protein singed wings 2 n=1 Tax=Aphidius gifuensis TaxID=684658 RepID=UPI001CDBCE0A|nr:protein singed wings 2 [Aphidius gifuensis]
MVNSSCRIIILTINSSEENNPCLNNLNKFYNKSSICLFIDEENNHLWCSGYYGHWKNNSTSIKSLTICNWPELSLNPEELVSNFPNIKNLIIANSNLTNFSSTFSPAKYLEKLQISETHLEIFPKDAFKSLTRLRILDLRNNSLAKIDPNELNEMMMLHHIYLAGNPWKCNDKSMTWILNMTSGSLSRRIVDRDKLHCSIPFEGRPLVSVIEIIMQLEEECKLTICECELVYVVGRIGRQTTKQLMAFSSVNCSHRNLTEMPKFIPTNVTTLRLDGNKISDLTPLVTNQVYRQVLDLYLDNNVIESINQLESSYWLENFRVFSLRGNKLTDLPTYALENVLLQSGNAVSIYLGDNPWTCDCLFTPGFQDLLISYTSLVKDIHDVKCHTGHIDVLNKPIRDLTRTQICITNDGEYFIKPIDMLNIFLASMIILILGKVIYDYWSFKKTGKLPWLVAKMP